VSLDRSGFRAVGRGAATRTTNPRPRRAEHGWTLRLRALHPDNLGQRSSPLLRPRPVTTFGKAAFPDPRPVDGIAAECAAAVGAVSWLAEGCTRWVTLIEACERRGSASTLRPTVDVPARERADRRSLLRGPRGLEYESSKTPRVEAGCCRRNAAAGSRTGECRNGYPPRTTRRRKPLCRRTRAREAKVIPRGLRADQPRAQSRAPIATDL
jgi:hypothetical protein